MTDGAEKNEPSAYNESNNSRTNENFAPKSALPGEEGPGQVGVALSWTKSRIRDLDSDKTTPREERALLRLYYTREREKHQLKLRVFGEAEKIKAVESAVEKIRHGDAVERTESQQSLEESLVKARSELQKASRALEHLCRDDAKWEKHEASARKWQESRTWQAITPEELQPAVEAIRHKVEHYGFWQSTQSTMKLCFAALHPQADSDAVSLAPYKGFLVALLGRRIENLLLGPDRPAPVIFKTYLDVLEAGMKLAIRNGFQEMFEVAKARSDVLGMHPVEWTKRQLDILIYAQKSGIRVWTKEVCDPMDISRAALTRDAIYWGTWRAPRLIHMQPAGNTPYDQASSWVREQLVKSEELLDARAEHTTDFLSLDLDELARGAHVEFVKRDAGKPPVSRPGEGGKQATPPPNVPSLGGTSTPDVWRSLHDRFTALADEELTLAPQNSGERWLRAYVDYRIKTNECGQWDLSTSMHENFRERFEVEATRAGIALGSDLTAEPLTLWLHHLFSDLLQHKSKFLFAATEEGGIIVRVCEASALYSARLEKQALIQGRKRPAENVVPSPVVDSAPTTSDDPRKATLREAVIRKVKNPHLYNSLSTPEAASYFEVEPRTIHRWIAEGDLRRGARRGSITIDSVLRLEKSRSRKRPNR